MTKKKVESIFYMHSNSKDPVTLYVTRGQGNKKTRRKYEVHSKCAALKALSSLHNGGDLKSNLHLTVFPTMLFTPVVKKENGNES